MSASKKEPSKRTSSAITSSKKLFLKKYSQIIYAVILIILIPLVIITNTVFVIRKFQKNTDAQLQRQALGIAEVFDATSFNGLQDIEVVQSGISQMLSGPEELRSFDVMVPEGEEFTILASSFESNIGKSFSGRNAIIAWGTDQGIAHLTQEGLGDIERVFEQEDQRFWNVIFPLHDDAGKKVALLNMKMSVRIIDDLTKKTLIESFGLLIVTLVIVLALLLTNTRLFQYAFMYRKLEEVNAMKDEFISMASHELRTPITAISGYISMFLEGSFGALSAQGKTGLEIIASSTRRLAGLVEDLLDVSRIEQSRLKLTLEKVDLIDGISQTITELKINADSKKLGLEFVRAGPVPPVYADNDKVRQILVNLIGNAIKYTKQGSVTVSTAVQDKKVKVKVKDTGIGIAAKDREQLFSKFYRVSSESTKGIVGTGLGLWITKQLITYMNGEIMVDSIEGEGTEFSFTLPIYTDAP